MATEYGTSSGELAIIKTEPVDFETFMVGNGLLPATDPRSSFLAQPSTADGDDGDAMNAISSEIGKLLPTNDCKKVRKCKQRRNERKMRLLKRLKMAEARKNSVPKELQKTCEDCSLAFASRRDLLVHMREEDHALHKCQYCGKHFTNPDSVKIHNRKSCGPNAEKQTDHEHLYSCGQCDAVYTKVFTVNTLRMLQKGKGSGLDLVDSINMETVTENGKRKIRLEPGAERSNLCQFCGKIFANCAALRRHNRRVCGPEAEKFCNGNFICTDCNAVYTHVGSLMKHRQLAHNPRRVLCSCGDGFARKWLYNRHLKV